MEQHVSHSLVQTLRRIPAFSELDETALLVIAGESMNLGWKAGTSIFRSDHEGEALYVLLDGECSIHDGDDAANGEVARLRSGDFFGELSLLMNTTHSRNATAMTDCEILVLPKDSFKRLLESEPSLADHFDRVAKERTSTLKKVAG